MSEKFAGPPLHRGARALSFDSALSRKSQWSTFPAEINNRRHAIVKPVGGVSGRRACSISNRK
jgi:hypothetical protein